MFNFVQLINKRASERASRKDNMKVNDELAFARLKASINNDDDYSFDDICNRYVRETKQNKELIDLTFISICGYSLETLLFDKDKRFMFSKQASEQT